MESIDRILGIIACIDVIAMVVFNFLNSTANDTTSVSYKKRTTIANAIFFVVLLTVITVSKAFKS